MGIGVWLAWLACTVLLLLVLYVVGVLSTSKPRVYIQPAAPGAAPARPVRQPRPPICRAMFDRLTAPWYSRICCAYDFCSSGRIFCAN